MSCAIDMGGDDMKDIKILKEIHTLAKEWFFGEITHEDLSSRLSSYMLEADETDGTKKHLYDVTISKEIAHYLMESVSEQVAENSAKALFLSDNPNPFFKWDVSNIDDITEMERAALEEI